MIQPSSTTSRPATIIVLTGVAVAAKQHAALVIIQALQAAGQTVTVLDNGDVPLTPVDVQVVRLRGGCVCCALASQLFASVRTITTDAAVLITSALAYPEVLALTVEGLQRPWREITTIALLDPATSERFPHLDAKLRLHADIVLAADSSATTFGEIVDALVCV